MKKLRPGTQKIGFLVKNYPYSLIPRSKLANPGPNTSNMILSLVLAPVLFLSIGSLGYEKPVI